MIELFQFYIVLGLLFFNIGLLIFLYIKYLSIKSDNRSLQKDLRKEILENLTRETRPEPYYNGPKSYIKSNNSSSSYSPSIIISNSNMTPTYDYSDYFSSSSSNSSSDSYSGGGGDFGGGGSSGDW